MFGIEAIQFYFPKTYVDQSQYGMRNFITEKYKGVGQGKYTKGLGQLQLSFVYPFEDINSISLTAVRNLLTNNNIKPSSVGRLEVGTQTLIDKSKSTKTVLMTLFDGNHDIQGATSINACYGATNALINTLNWISSPSWDGRYGIVVAADIAVYEDGPARCTGGAGAIAMLIGPNPKVIFKNERSTYIDHQYDFYKPIPGSQYPIVDGKLSIDCYLKAVEQCYRKLKQKCKGTNIQQKTDFYCFHTPFYKMVQKAFDKLATLQDNNHEKTKNDFMNKVHPSLYFSQRLGNIYTGSVFASLISLFYTSKQSLIGKNILLFSYGSGLCSSMLMLSVSGDLLTQRQKLKIENQLINRKKISPEQYSQVMAWKQNNFGKMKGKIAFDPHLIGDNVYYLKEIDDKWRRFYSIKEGQRIQVNPIGSSRLQNLNNHMVSTKEFSKFYKLSIDERVKLINDHLKLKLDSKLLENGGLDGQMADSIGENVIGLLSLPLSVSPSFVINNKRYIIPMCTQQSSVIAACNAASKFIAPYSFFTSSTPNIMIGQVHIPNAETDQIHRILSQKDIIISDLNTHCESMVKRGGGVTDFRVRELKGKQYVAEIHINVCEAMGANIVNTLCERAKQLLSKIGIMTGIGILTNYCLERMAFTYFEVPVKELSWKNVNGYQVAAKILTALDFAKCDRFRATTHNKGIMNGIDSVCVATGQDWRAVESSAHSYASRSGHYMPLSNYKIITKDGVQFFRGSLQLPIAVGTKGGAITKNPLYKLSMQILGNPCSQQLAEIMATVGLAQNFAAIRALAVQGIQKGHMALHTRSIAQQAGVPKDLIEDACRYMTAKRKYNLETAVQFLNLRLQCKL